MIAKIVKTQYYTPRCSGSDCIRNSQYFQDEGKYLGFFRRGTYCVQLTIMDATAYYCKDCAKILFQKLKPILNTDLWAFE